MATTERSEGNEMDAFAIFDMDNDGVISAGELKTMMSRIGNALSDAEVRDIMTETGEIGPGITYSQFQRLMCTKIGKRADVALEPEAVCRHAFQLFDTDGDGMISQAEMRVALSGFGITLTEKEVERVIAEATLTSTGDRRKVSYEIFKKVMMQG